MPGADELLEAMRKAGQDFAKMADSMETRLPAIMASLSDAATQLKPLTAELTLVQEKIKDISKAAGKVTFKNLVDELKVTNAGMATFFKSADAVSKKLGKISMKHIQDEIQGVSGSLADMATKTAKAAQSAIREISGMGSALGDTLEERTVQTQKLAAKLKDLGKGGGGGGGAGTSLEVRNAAELTQHYSNLVEVAHAFAAAGDGGNRALQSLQGYLTGIGQTTISVDDDVTDLVNSYKALGPAIGEARDNAEKLASGVGLDEWKKSSEDALKSIEEATVDIQKRSGIDLGHGEWIDNLKKNIKSLGTDSGPEAFDAVAKEMEKLKATTHLISNDMIGDIKKQAETMEEGILFGRGQHAKMYKWRKSQEIMHGMLLKQGHGKRMSRLKAWWAAWKDHPLESVRNDIKGIGDALSNSARESGLFTKGFVATAKNAMRVRDKIIEQREELMKLTAEGGRMSSLFQSGMGGDAVVAEFDKLNQSMNNLFNRTGMTTKQTREMMGTLMEAGVSMDELTGPTIKAADAQGLLRSKGEYAMSGLEDLGRLAKMTGRSFGDIGKLAGKWREELGVSIGDVKDTYLDLESQARRSGLSVGKFMDRVMSATSGFVLFGGRAEDVAKTMSDLMSSMELPPSMAADMAKSFTDVMQNTTAIGAMEITAFLGSEGQKYAMTQLDAYVKNLQNQKKTIDAEIATTRTKMLAAKEGSEEREQYASQLARQKRSAQKLGDDLAKKQGLYDKAANNDLGAMSQLIMYQQKSAGAGAAQVRLASMAGRLSLDIESAMADGMDPMEAMSKAFDERASTIEGWAQLEGDASVQAMGGVKAVQELLTGQKELVKRTQKAAKLITKSEEEMKVLEKLFQTGTAKQIADAIGENLKTPQEVLENLKKLRDEGGMKVSDAAIKELEKQAKAYEEVKGTGKEAEEKRSEALRKSLEGFGKEITGKFKPPDIKKDQTDPLIKAQQKTQDIIEEHQNALMNKLGWQGTFLIGILANTALMAAGSIFKGFGKKGAKGARRRPPRRKSPSTRKAAQKTVRRAAEGKPAGKLGTARKFAGEKLGKIGEKLGKVGEKLGTAKKFAGKQLGKVGEKLGVVKKFAGKQLGRVASRASGLIPKAGIGKSLASGASKLMSGGAKAAAKVGGKKIPIVGTIIAAGFAVAEVGSAYKEATKAAEEQARAVGKSEEEIAKARSEAGKESIKETGSAAAGSVVGAGAGTALGAALGSFLAPGIGTYIGGMVGGLVGEEVGRFIGGLKPVKKAWSVLVDGAYGISGAFGKVTGWFTKDAKKLEEAAKKKEAAVTKEIRDSENKAASIEDEIMAVEQGPDVDPFADKYEQSAEEIAAIEAEKKKKLAELEEQLFQERKKQIMALAEEESKKSFVGRMAFKLRRGKVEEMATKAAKKYASEQLQKRREGGTVAHVAREGAEPPQTAEAKERDRKIKLAKLEEDTPAFDVKRVSRGGMAYLSMKDIVIHGDEMAKAIEGAKGTAAGPFKVKGATAAAGDKASGVMRGVVSTVADKGDAGGAGGGAFTDNSTWTVNISSHRDKEIEAIVRKVMIEQQERQAP